MAKHLSLKEYDAISAMLADGASYDQIAHTVKRGKETVARVNGSSDFEDYKRNAKLSTGRYIVGPGGELVRVTPTVIQAQEEIALEEPADDEPALIRELRQQQRAIYQQFEDVIKTLEKLR